MSNRVPNRGPAGAAIMVVGEAPGANEERLGQAFVGESGRLLEESLRAVGINPEGVYYANICQYRPPRNEIRTFFDKNGIPNEMVLQGLAILKTEIERINPTVIVPLGNYPMKMLTGKGRWRDGYTGIGDYRGSILEGAPITGGRKCIPTFHPASIIREYSNKPILKADFRRVAEQATFPEIRRPAKRLILDPRGAERDAWAAWLTSAPGTLSPEGHPSGAFITGDIEYIGSRLLCVGLTRHADVAVTFGTSSIEDIRYVHAILACSTPQCWHNAMFDCSILQFYYGIDCFQHLKHDSMYAMHCAYTEYPKDLGFVGSIFTEQPFWKDMVDWKKVSMGEQPIGDVYHYNAIDTWVTHEAMEKLLEDELQDPDVASTYAFEMSLVPPLWDLSNRGVRIDHEGMVALRSRLESEILDCMAGISLMAGGSQVNVRSATQVAKFVYETLGVRAKGPKTPKGQWKMNDDTLAALLLKAETDRQRNGIKLVRAARERLNMISKFVDIDLDDDGRMRCHYDAAKTQTGRLASRKFYPTNRGANLQNIPRETFVRKMFLPDKGMIMGYADLKQAESLVVSHLCGDPEMLRLHSPEFESQGGDGHAYVASYIFQKPISLITKEERFIGKKIRHACNYAMGWFRLMQVINAEAQSTGVSITAAQAKIYVARYRELHFMLTQWWSTIEGELYSTRKLKTLLNRPHTFFGRLNQILPEAIAFKPQGTVADTTNIGFIRLYGGSHPLDKPEHAVAARAACEELQDYNFQTLLQVHDAIGFQCAPAHAGRVCEIVREQMSVELPIQRRGVDPYTITIPVDIKLGMNWGEYDPKNPDGLRSWNGQVGQ